MNKFTPILVILMFHVFFSYAQEIEVKSALRSSQNIYQGSARFMGMGGAFTALGADLSGVGLNPAGVGVYTGFQLEFTSAFQYQQSRTSSLSNTHENFDYNLNLNNAGLAGAYTLKSPGWKSINIGLGYNTMNDYAQDLRTEIFNRTRSFMHEFVDNANRGTFRAAYEDLAWQTYLLNYDSTANEYWNHVTDEMRYTADTSSGPYGIGVNQRKNRSNGGSLGEYFLAIGANYNNKLYLGFSLGIQSYNFTYKDTYSEFEKNNQVQDFHSMDFIEYEEHNGSGFNFKLGAIYRPTDYIRIGAAFHSPTYFNNHSYSWYNSMRASYDNGDNLQIDSETKDFSYQLITPSKILGGVAMNIQKRGIISIDYERINYGRAKLKEEKANIPFDYENDSIQNTYATANNIRIGGELKLDQFYLRGGFALYQSPYSSTYSNYQSDMQQYSGGLGYREKGFFIDASFSTMQYVKERPLLSTIPNLSEIDLNNNQFTLTVGIRF